MPSASEFSITPDENLTIGGFNVAEGCPPASINNAIRYMAAVARDSYNRLPATGSYLASTGGTITGSIIRSGGGAHFYHARSDLTTGAIWFQQEGSARPTAAEGTVVFYHS